MFIIYIVLFSLYLNKQTFIVSTIYPVYSETRCSGSVAAGWNNLASCTLVLLFYFI